MPPCEAELVDPERQPPWLERRAFRDGPSAQTPRPRPRCTHRTPYALPCGPRPVATASQRAGLSGDVGFWRLTNASMQPAIAARCGDLRERHFEMRDPVSPTRTRTRH